MLKSVLWFPYHAFWWALAKLANFIYAYRKDPAFWLIVVILFELGLISILWQAIQEL